MFKAIRVSVLILLLACSTQAGYMPSGGSQPTPTPTPEQAFFAEEAPVEADAPDDLTVVLAEAALSVLTTALALL